MKKTLLALAALLVASAAFAQTDTPTETNTPTETPTLTPTPTATDTPTQTHTPSNTPTNTFTPSKTPTNTPTPTNTFTASNTPTNTYTPSPTNTPASSRLVAPHFITVPAGGTVSNQIELNPGQQFNLTVMAPATLAETATVEIAEVGGGTWRALSVGGSDVTVAAGKAVIVSGVSAAQIRIKLGGAAAASRTFAVAGSGK